MKINACRPTLLLDFKIAELISDRKYSIGNADKAVEFGCAALNYSLH